MQTNINASQHLADANANTVEDDAFLVLRDHDSDLVCEQIRVLQSIQAYMSDQDQLSDPIVQVL